MNTFEKYKSLFEGYDTESMNFKKWFDKSVMHKNNVPETFYHGTGSDIEAFSHDHIGKGNDSHGTGFYFTNDPEVSDDFAYGIKKNNETPTVYPVHLSIKKPIIHDGEKTLTRTQIKNVITSAPNHRESLMNYGNVDYEGYHKVLNDAIDQYETHPVHSAFGTLHNDFYRGNDSQYLKNFTRHTGYDGVLVNHDSGHKIVVAFHPNQIKSSIGNMGYYSKKSDKLTESEQCSKTTTH